MDVMTFRQATSIDKEAVIGIHDNVYEGLDTIASYFDDFVNCPLTTPYVALIDNKIVGFVATFIIDDGQTVVTRAARMSPSVGGKGLYKQLKAHALLASGVTTHSFTAVNANPNTQKESFRATNKHIITKLFTRFLFDAGSLKSLDTPIGMLNKPNDDDIKLYLSTDAVKHYLFPKNRLIVNWVPFRDIATNVPLLRSGKRTMICSDVSIPEDGQVKGLLSFSTTSECKKPMFACVLDIYGTDTTTLKDHVVSHIRYTRALTKVGATALLVFVEPTFDMHVLENIFGDVGLQKSEWRDSEDPELIYSELYLFDNEI